MKNLFLTKTRWLVTILLLITFAVPHDAWGAIYSLTPNQASTGSSSTSYITSLTEFSYTSGSAITWKMNQWNPSNLQVKANQSNASNEFRFYNNSAFAGKITKVVITLKTVGTVSNTSGFKFLGGTSAQTATTSGASGTWNATAKTITWTPASNTSYTYFAFYQNGKVMSGNNYLANSDAIVVTYLTAVTLDKNGGSANGAVKFDHNATEYATSSFTAVTRSNYTCTGYWTAASGGTKVLNANGSFAGTSVSESSTTYISSSKWVYAPGTLTLYAQWASSGTSVSLTKSATTNGSITLTPASSVTTTGAAGVVTVTATPDAGYYLSNLTASTPSTGTATVAADFSTVTYSSGANGSSTITATFSPIWQLRGDFNNWDDSDPLTSYSNGVATITKTLNANTKYEFQFYDARQSTDAARYHGNNGCIVEDISGWQFNTGSPAPNAKLFTGKAGTYTFKFTLSNRNLQIIYPEVTDHPNASYNYFKKWADWNNSFYVYWWGASDLTGYNNAIQVTKSVNICETDYVYFPILTDYTNFIVKTAASGDGAHKTGDITSANSHGGDYHDCTSWREFETYTISYAGGTGSSGGPMTQESGICPGGSQKLTACAFYKTDYTFAGWSDGNGHTYADEATITNIQSNITLTAQWVLTPVITVSATSSINMGIIKVDDTSERTFTVSGSNLISDITLAIATADADYVYYSIDKTTLSPTAGSVGTTTITITYTPTTSGVHNVNNLIVISATGAETKYVSVGAGAHYVHSYIDNIWNTSIADKTDTYDRPTISDQDPGAYTDCQHLHYHFVGWITKAKYDEGTTIDTRTAPTGDIQATGSVAKPTSNETFYAVWEKKGSGGDVDDELNNANTIGESTSSYSSWIVSTSSTSSGAAYSGQSAGDHNSIQLRSNNSNSGIVTTTSGGKATKMVVTWNSNTVATRTISIYGKNTAYSTPTDLYNNSNQGTLLGELNIDNATSNVSELNITGDYEYIGIRSKSGALYLDDITITWSSITYTDPIASCGAEYDITLDKNGGTTNGSAVVTANATALNSGFTAPIYAGHQVDYYMVASADNSTKIAEADGSLVANVSVSSTPWTDANGKWVKGGDATIYAKWKYAEYEIAYYDQGGSAFSGVHGANHPTTHTYNTATTLVNPTKNGYDFAGWYTSADCSTGLVTTLGATAYTSGPINLYAKWTGKTYTVTWVVNGNTIATQNNVTYGTTYEDLSSTPANPADNALADCGSDKFVGWVTAEYTAEGGTKGSQYDPYAVTNSTTIDDTHHTFYAMFAKESGTAFSLSGASGSTQDVKISCIIGGTRYYATGTANSSGYSGTTDAASANTYTFTKVSDGIYTIKKGTKYVIQKTSGKTALDESASSFNWEISTPGSNGTWRVKCKTNDEARAIIGYKNTNSDDFGDFKAYATSNTTGGNASMYFDLELGTSNLTNYRTGCCSETITLTVSDATSGAGGTVAMKWNNASKSSGDQVSTCSTGTLVVEVTANPTYTLTAITIAGTNKTITLDPSDLTTGLPSTSKMTYTVTVPSLATGTLTITPTFTRTYSVTYNLDGGETAGSTAVANYQSGATVTLVTPNPTKSGYNFAGWDIRDASSNVVTETSGHFTMPASNVTVTATWTAKPLTSISVTPATATVYVGQYVQIPVTYDPADILTKGYTLVSTPSFCVTTGSTNTTFKITGGRGGVTITENKIETVSIKADADNTKTASVTVTVKPLPVDKFVDLIHGETFADQAASIVDNNLTTAYSAPGHADVPVPASGNTCEKEHLHLVGWIESEWANAHLTATMSEIIAAEDAEHNPLFFAVYAPMNASGKTYYAVWGKEVTP